MKCLIAKDSMTIYVCKELEVIEFVTGYHYIRKILKRETLGPVELVLKNREMDSGLGCW